mmetsp:Transcript_55877/g.86880  ORF Transcript_55877/g.86880 Transcript_55877/m.86880 type:complete len:301 (-) Transcript_55877:62-964(-)
MCMKPFHVSASPCVAASIILAVVSLSITLCAAEESILISQNDAAPPPVSVEARIKLRQHREASALNRFTFNGNVLDGIGDVVEHWFVMFCPGWHDKCQSLLPSYELLGVQWEDKLNTALMSSKVRFAKVDCATEKALCVSLGIDDYPSVVHYRHQQHVNAWFGGAPGLVRWVKEEIQSPKRRASAKKNQIPSGQSNMETVLEKTIDQVIKQSVEQNTCIDGSAAMAAEGRGWLWQSVLKSLALLLILGTAVYYCVSKHMPARFRNNDSPTNSEDSPNTSKRQSGQGQPRAASSAVQSIIL